MIRLTRVPELNLLKLKLFLAPLAWRLLYPTLSVPELSPDIEFIRTAALLHDIGIFMTHAPKFGCFGDHPYLAHGYLGRELLEREG